MTAARRRRVRDAFRGTRWSKRPGGLEFRLGGPPSAKDGVGAALSERSRVWFTISHGIVNEIYYPRVDRACVRDLGLIVTDGDTFFAEVKRDCETVVERIEDGVPAFRLCCSWTWPGARARLRLRICNSSGRWSSARRASSCEPDPRTQQDRWEENAGYTPFTLAVAVASLLAAAEIAEACDIEAVPALLRDTADAWNEQIEDWIYVEDTPLAREAGVRGYYIRVAPESPAMGCPDVHGLVQVRNHEMGSGAIPADELISTDALALVRFGLRAPEDPRVLGTIALIDCLLKVELPQGPGWRRYNLDGYGEKADGRPSTGSGSVACGRFWRANERITRLRRESAKRLKRCSRRSRRRPVLAASFPSRCGTPRPFPKGSLRPANRRGRRCRSSGRTGNM